jgi:hypothetical protein
MNDLVSRLETIFASASSKVSTMWPDQKIMLSSTQSVSFSKVTDEIMEDVLEIRPRIPDEHLSMKPQEDLVTLATQRNKMGENSL